MKCPLIYLLCLGMVNPDTHIITEPSMDEPNFTTQRAKILTICSEINHIHKINVMLD